LTDVLVEKLNISDYGRMSKLYDVLGGFVMKFSNKDDILSNKISKKISFKNIFYTAKWALLEISIACALALIMLIFGRPKDDNIAQLRVDRKTFRTKYYPTLALSFVSALFVLINISLFAFSQFSIFTNYQLDTKALTTFVVDSSADDADFSIGDGFCDTNDSVGDGPCTFRGEIQESDVTVDDVAITFNIPGAGVHTLVPATIYPSITKSIVIDATTETGTVCSTSTLMVELNGMSIGGGADGLQISTTSSSNITIKGLVIQNFNGPGITLTGSTAGTAAITCNIIGLDSDKVTINANENGIMVGDNFTATIGGLTADERNVISGNTTTGISVSGNGITNIIGNYIGTAATGTQNKGNNIGIQLSSGMDTIDNNVISYNTTGIKLHGGYNDTIGPLEITNNIIGLDADGVSPAGNGTGIYFTTGDQTEGYWGNSTIEISGNTISDNQMPFNNTNLSFEGHAFEGIVFDNNRIGVGVVDDIDLGNVYGIRSEAPMTITNNNFSYTSDFDYALVLFSNSTVTNNNFNYNFSAVHLDYDNTSFSGNQFNENTVSMTVSGSSNEITSNTICNTSGGEVFINNSNLNKFSLNKFGSVNDTSIEVIGTSVNNSFTHNAFAQSIEIPIDLNDDGPTANDAGDVDTGANNRQNYPDNFSLVGSDIEFDFDTNAGDYRIEFHIPDAGSCSTLSS
ncbi:MAG TPA: hypothetical protein PLS50_06090, partial [Candidatus Dojkabacteria bacterium]|nr:hypothetical protein [Candidatus Dojkabacteria bacterium]